MSNKAVYVLAISLSFMFTSTAYSEQVIDIDPTAASIQSAKERNELLGWKVSHRSSSDQGIETAATTVEKQANRERSALLGWKVIHQDQVAEAATENAQNNTLANFSGSKLFGWSSSKN